MEGLDLSQLISIIALVSGVVTAWLAVGRSSKNETKDDAAADATLHADVAYIREGIDEIKQDVKRHNKEIVNIDKRLTIVEHDIKDLKGETHEEL